MEQRGSGCTGCVAYFITPLIIWIGYEWSGSIRTAFLVGVGVGLVLVMLILVRQWRFMAAESPDVTPFPPFPPYRPAQPIHAPPVPSRSTPRFWLEEGVRLGMQGRHAEAARAEETAIRLLRDRTSPADREELGHALSNIAITYGDMGRTGDAISAVREAVDVFRALFETDARHSADLAWPLANLGTLLHESGRHEEALPPAEESERRYRAAIAEGKSDLNGYLASTLETKAQILHALNRPSEAASAADQATLIRDRLGQSRKPHPGASPS